MWDGPIARDLERLWWVMLIVGVAVYTVVLVVLVVPVFRGRRDDAPDDGKRPDVPERTATRWIVAGGVLLPAVVLPVVLAMSVVTSRGLPQQAGEDGLVVEMTGHQWWWEVQYPNGVTTANEVHIPVGEPVELRFASADVIHAFWAPGLAGKIDALPDKTTSLVIEADRPGEYRARCAEFCGLQHAKMHSVVIAHPPDDFEAWLTAQSRPAGRATGDAARGEGVFLANGCGSCHTVRGTSESDQPGPDLTHFASRRTLTAALVSADIDSLERWITDPDMVKEGTTMPAMPLTGDELDALLVYLRSLE